MRGRKPTLLAALLAAAAAVADCRATEPRPNVLLITLDALRQDHLSFNGYHRETSPNIDWLARRGTVFPTIVPTGCSTKASLTSLFVSRGYRHHRIIFHGGILDEQSLTFAEVFRENGYETGGFVATPHLLAEMQYDQGFDRYEDFTAGAGRDASTFLAADRVVDAALDFLRARPEGRPFFAYLHLEEPHPPWVHSSPWLGGVEAAAAQLFSCSAIPTDEQFDAVRRFRRRQLIARYDGAIRFADVQIGRLLDHLRDRDLMRNTIVAVSTDHGIELLERYSASHGMNPFDEVVKTFLVLYDPKGTHPDTDTEVQGRIFDIPTTLLRRAGLPVPEAFDGVDLIGDGGDVPELAFVQCYNGEAVRSSRFKLVHVTDPPKGSRRAARFLPPGPSLYDLVNDPGETTDVRARYPEQFRQMEEALQGYLADLGRNTAPARELRDEELSEEALERLRLLGYVE